MKSIVGTQILIDEIIDRGIKVYVKYYSLYDIYLIYTIYYLRSFLYHLSWNATFKRFFIFLFAYCLVCCIYVFGLY
jgi:hypothetical protein